MVEKTLQLKQLRHRALAINCFLLLIFDNPWNYTIAINKISV
jgi:hypothetical protein